MADQAEKVSTNVALLQTPHGQRKVQRYGEAAWLRRVFALWAPCVHALLSFLLSLILAFVVDGTRVHSGERKSYSDLVIGKGILLHAGDITTVVSLALVLIRFCGHSFTIAAIWWCALILLQHDGLDLSQLDTLLSYQVLPPSAWSGKHSRRVALALFMMLPAAFISPLVTGSVDWVAMERNDNSTVGFLGGFGADNHLRIADQFWRAFKNGNRQARQEIVYNAQGNAGLTWFDDTYENRTAKWGLSRYAASTEAGINSDLENVPMPYILVHSISWNSTWDSWALERLFTPKDILFALGGTYNATTYAIGNGILFSDGIFPEAELPPGLLYHARDHKVAIMIGGGTGTPRTGEKCNITEPVWDDLSGVQLRIGAHRTCWAIGTVNFTAGIRTFDRGVFLAKRVVEGREDNHGMAKVEHDPWAEYATSMLSELMMVLPSARDSRLATGNLTAYTEELIRHAYISTRSVLHPYPNGTTLHLKLNSPVTYLEAKVNKVRVFIWLILTIMLPAAGLVLLWIENECTQHIRAPAVSSALIPVLMDVREILEKDRNGISNSSYVTTKDSVEIGKLQLAVIGLDSGGDGIGLRPLT